MPEPGYLLMAAEKRKALTVAEAEAVERIRFFLDDDILGPVAQTSLDLIEHENSDPRLLAALMDAMARGEFGTPARGNPKKEETNGT